MRARAQKQPGSDAEGEGVQDDPPIDADGYIKRTGAGIWNAESAEVATELGLCR